jgi:CPA1 family monovalent cation:H+ antiporter
MFVSTVATHYLIGLSWPVAALFGAIMVVTGPTVIIPMLRSVKPNAKVSKALRWEGIVIDPLGALLAVLVFEWIVAQQTSADLTHVFGVFTQTIALGLMVGVVAGQLFGVLLRHQVIPEYLQNYAAIAFVIAAFAASNTLLHESGLLTVTIMGIWLTNMKDVHIRDILNFKETLTVILVSSLFIILAARVDFGNLLQLGWAAIAVLLVMQFVARPLKVFLSTLGSTFTLNERLVMAWIGPRGIVAAAVSVVFALRLEELGVESAELLVPLAFTIIIGTVVIQSATARPLARLLGVGETGNQGFLVIGANPLGIAIAKALESADIKTTVCDTKWERVREARMAGLDTYHGNPISDHADLHLELAGLEGMLGLSPFQSDNLAAALRFREDFGIRNIFALSSRAEAKSNARHRPSAFYKGQVLFDENIRYEQLIRLLRKGATIKKTQLSENYDFEQWREENPADESVLLFAIDGDGNLHWRVAGEELKAQRGWSLYALRQGPDRTADAS